MAANTLFSQPFLHVVDANEDPIVGAKATFFEAGTSTPQPVYTDPGLSVAWLQPVTTNAAGNSSGPIYVTPTPALKIVVVTATDGPVDGYPCDFWSPSSVAS